MRPFAGILFVIVATLPLGSCGDTGNPILGKWVLDEEAMDPQLVQGARLSVFGDGIEFHEDKAIFGGNTRDVTYEFEGDRIIVTAQDGQGSMFTLSEEGRLLIEGPAGTLILRRTE